MTNRSSAMSIAPGARRLAVVPTTRRPLDRNAAVQRVRDARRLVLPRHERFAHLKRMHD
jgi:hypothetical protein